MSVDVEYFGEIDLEEPSDESLLDDISAFFDRSSESSTTVLVAIQLD